MFENFYLFTYQKCATKEPTFLFTAFKLLLDWIFNYNINYMLIQDALWGIKNSLRNLLFRIELCRCNEMNL